MPAVAGRAIDEVVLGNAIVELGMSAEVFSVGSALLDVADSGAVSTDVEELDLVVVCSVVAVVAGAFATEMTDETDATDEAEALPGPETPVVRPPLSI